MFTECEDSLLNEMEVDVKDKLDIQHVTHVQMQRKKSTFREEGFVEETEVDVHGNLSVNMAF